MIPEGTTQQWHAYDTTAAIRRMAYKRLAKGASKESVIERLENLAKGTWKNSQVINAFIHESLNWRHNHEYLNIPKHAPV